MPICGCCCCCISDCGAFGFSNEKSLEYCTRMLRLGAALSAVAGAGPPPPFAPSPFVVVMISLRDYRNPAEMFARVAITSGKPEQGRCGHQFMKIGADGPRTFDRLEPVRNT